MIVNVFAVTEFDAVQDAISSDDDQLLECLVRSYAARLVSCDCSDDFVSLHEFAQRARDMILRDRNSQDEEDANWHIVVEQLLRNAKELTEAGPLSIDVEAGFSPFYWGEGISDQTTEFLDAMRDGRPFFRGDVDTFNAYYFWATAEEVAAVKTNLEQFDETELGVGGSEIHAQFMEMLSACGDSGLLLTAERFKVSDELRQGESAPLWSWSDRLLPIAYKSEIADLNESPHRQGGPTRHDGAKCPKCRQMLKLCWEIDLNEIQGCAEILRGISPATRLPLYLCMQCLVASYRTVSDCAIQPFWNGGLDYTTDDESPFFEIDVEIPEQGLLLSKLSSNVDGLIQLASEVGISNLDDAGRETLEATFGKKIDRLSEISTFGGAIPAVQGQECLPTVCPNERCPASRHGRTDGWRFRPFVFIDHEQIKEFKWQISVRYYICSVCFAICGHYECS